MFPETWDHERITRHGFCEVLTNQKIIIENQERIMSALSDLQAAVTKLNTDVTAFIAANSGGATDAQLQTITTAITAIDNLVNPPAPTPPAA